MMYVRPLLGLMACLLGPVGSVGAAAPVTLVKDGKPAATIVIADEPTARAPSNGTLLLVGRSALSEQYRLALPTKPEGLRIVTFARGVAILGERRADKNRTSRLYDWQLLEDGNST